MQPSDWNTPFARELLALIAERIAERVKDYDKSINHETTRYTQGRLKELRWLQALKDSSNDD